MAEQVRDSRASWSFHADLADGRVGAHGRSSSASAIDRCASSVSVPRGTALSPAMHDWLVGRHGEGGAVSHDVHLTMRDEHGVVIGRWCLRHADVAARDGGDLGELAIVGYELTSDDLVITCERIDLEWPHVP